MRTLAPLILAATLATSLALGLAACKKSEEAAPPAPTTATPAAGTVGADGVRRIEITASEKGYVPDRIEGKPGEKLVLVFTRTLDGECLEKVKVAGGAEIELPMNKPTDVPVEVPASGEVKFACGMDMFTGVIVAKGA
jgi:plastocyanin domain-containing protein